MSYSVVTNYKTTLASPMTDSQLTVPVSSILTRDATPHTIVTADMGDGWYLTIAPGTANEEIVEVTAVTPGSGDAGTFTVPASGRGLAYYGTSDSQGAGNAKPHNPGDVVILSNVKNVYDRLVDKETDETIDGIKTFLDLPVIPQVPSSATQTASKGYVDSVVVAAGGITAGYVTQNGADPSLTINVGAGYFIFGSTNVTFAGASAQAVTAASTNYVQLKIDGSLVVNTTGYLGGHIPLATVVTDGTDITSITDTRPFFTQPETVKGIITSIAYGATIAVGDAVYVNVSSGKWELTSGAASGTAVGPIGIALDAGVNNDTNKRVQTSGLVTGLSGLTTGYNYVSDTPGQISTTPGTVRKTVGRALSTTTLMLMDTFQVARITGANTDATTTNFNEAMTFFANTNATGAEMETLTDGSDASGLHYHNVAILGGTRAANTASGNQTFAHGLGRTPKYIEVFVTLLASTALASGTSSGASNGTAHMCSYTGSDSGGGGAEIYTAGRSSSFCVFMDFADTGTTDATQTATASFDATNVTLAWVLTGGGTLANNMNITIIAHA